MQRTGAPLAPRRIAASLLLLAIVLGVLLLVHPQEGGGATVQGERRALYYDSLAREYPDPDLAERVVGALERAGYEVTVLTGKEAGLEALEGLSGYDLIIIRAHGAYNGDPESGRPLGTYIYTGLTYQEAAELYGKKMIDSMLRDGDLALGVVPPPGFHGDPRSLTKYIAVSPQFLERYNHAYRPGTIVVFTGCYGAEDGRLASTFIERGARAFIAWRGDVTWTVSDESLARLVELLAGGADPGAAVSSLPETLRVDPFTGARLLVVERGGG